MAAKSLVNKRSKSHRVVTTAVPQYRVVKQGATLTDDTRQCTLAAAILDVPLGVSLDTGGNPASPGAVGVDLQIGQDGEYPVEVAAAVVIGDILIVDATGGIGRVKPVGATARPYWVVGVARSAQPTIGSTAQVEFRPMFNGA